MKKLLILAIALFSFQMVDAQFKFGVKAGLATTDIDPDQLLITSVSEAEEFGLAVQDAKLGVHMGVFMRFGRTIFFQPEILFNTSKVTYEFSDFSQGETYTNLFSERYNTLDIPLLLGLKLGPLRINGGPVGHVFLSNTSDLLDVEGYGQDFKDLTIGYQAGVGLDIWKILIDLRYEGNFSKFGNHIEFFGNEYKFDQTPARIVASIGFAF